MLGIAKRSRESLYRTPCYSKSPVVTDNTSEEDVQAMSAVYGCSVSAAVKLSSPAVEVPHLNGVVVLDIPLGGVRIRHLAWSKRVLVNVSS